MDYFEPVGYFEQQILPAPFYSNSAKYCSWMSTGNFNIERNIDQPY